MTLLADNRPEEVKMARIIAGMPGAALMPFQGSIGAGLLPGVAVTDATVAALRR
jgi:hypothetical protein